MNFPIESDRSLVIRIGAERYLLLTLISFAASVIVTRLFLSMTGYPQLGNSQLHIAHVLWGGLLLFISGLLPLVVANAWGYSVGAVLNGVGMGLFIDEIGKFITQTNDYFYPPAAPIIYAFFLLTVLLYVYIRRTRRRSPRRLMYQVLHDLGEVIDHDLQPTEKAQLTTQLDEVLQSAPNANMALLAEALNRFLAQESLHVREFLPAWQRRWVELRHATRERIQRSQGGRSRFRLALAALIALAGGVVVVRLSLLVVTLIFDRGGLLEWVQQIILSGEAATLGELRWAVIRVLLEGALGLVLAISGVLLLLRLDNFATRLAALSLVMLLTTVDLLVFYFDQFTAVSTALAQFALLALVLVYRRWFISETD